MHDTTVNAKEIVLKLKAHGYEAFFAGGWVRDYIMGHPSSDIDIATNAPPNIIVDLFPHTILVGLVFGVVIVVKEGHQFEVSTFRKDLHYSNGRKPDAIAFSDAKEDALRRDFTINGMFYDPIEHVIHDYVDGIKDIQENIIRTIGDPYERFSEDRLRMVRAVRFAARFGFTIDTQTQEAVRAMAEMLLPAVAWERIWQELVKMSLYPHTDAAIIEMHRLELLQVIFPVLKATHLRDIKQRVKGYPLFPAEAPAALYLAELLPESSLKDKLDIFKQMKVSNRDLRLVELHHTAQDILKSEQEGQAISNDRWVSFMAKETAQLCWQCLLSGLEQQEQKKYLFLWCKRYDSLDKHIQRKKTRKPLLTAAHLQNMGIKPGKELGMLLFEADKLAINNDLKSPEEVLKLLHKMNKIDRMGTG